MNRDDIAAVMEDLPTLNSHGIGIYRNGRGLTVEQRDQELAKGRADLLASVSACSAVCLWLSSMEKSRTINHRHSSYGLKHHFERETGRYVTNGAFIAAAIHSGFRYRIESGSPNVLFNIAERSLKSLRV